MDCIFVKTQSNLISWLDPVESIQNKIPTTSTPGL